MLFFTRLPFSDFNMDKFNLLLSLCQSQCKEVAAVGANEAAKFDRVTVVRGTSCSYTTPLLQDLAVNCNDLSILLEHFTNWGEDKMNVQFPETRLLTALMPTVDVEHVPRWFHSAIVPMECVHDPILLVSTGNCLTGFHVDDKPPTEVVASLLRGRKLWMFATPGSKSASILVKRPEDTHLDQLIEDMVYHRYRDLSYCLQEPGDTVCFPARTVHFVLSVTPDNEWNCLLSHNILHGEAEAVALERKAFNRCSGPQYRTVQGKRTRRSGVTKKRFTSHWNT